MLLQADQRIAAADGVVEELERLVLGQRQQPQRQLGHLDGQRVLVHAVQAALGDQAAGIDLPILDVLRGSSRSARPALPLPFGGDAGSSRLGLLLVLPRFEQPLRQIPARLHQERPGAARHVADLEVEQFLGRAQLPLFLRLPLGGADVHERFQRVLDDGLGQAAGRVVRAAGAPVGPRRDEDAPLADDHGPVEGVVPQQPGEGLHPLEQSVVVAADGPQLVGLLAVERRGEGLLERLLLPAGFVVQEGEQVGFALGLQPFQFGEGDLGLLAFGPGQPQHRLRGTLGGVVEQTFVDVADLFDVERPEAEPAGLALHLQVLQRAEQVQHRAIVDRQRRGRGGAPRRPRLAAFEEREAVGVEQIPAVGG